MRLSIRSRLIALVRAQWAGLLALFLVIAGGTAYAANTVSSTDIINGEVKSVDIGNNEVRSVDVRDDSLAGGGLGHVDLKAGSVRSSEVGADSLTGADVQESSLVGVLGCPTGFGRFEDVCYSPVETVAQNWSGGITACGVPDFRLPTVTEAYLAVLDMPSSDLDADYWTSTPGIAIRAFAGGGSSPVIVTNVPAGAFLPYFCVTAPTN